MCGEIRCYYLKVGRHWSTYSSIYKLYCSSSKSEDCQETANVAFNLNSLLQGFPYLFTYRLFISSVIRTSMSIQFDVLFEMSTGARISSMVITSLRNKRHLQQILPAKNIKHSLQHYAHVQIHKRSQIHSHIFVERHGTSGKNLESFILKNRLLVFYLFVPSYARLIKLKRTPLIKNVV